MWTIYKAMCNLFLMKKLLILSVLVLTLTGCNATPKTSTEEAKNIAEDIHVSTEINKLQLQLENGAVTEKYAAEKLKQILKERQKQNSGDTEVILEKIKNQDPILEKGLAEMIQRRQEKDTQE
jgi:hypothetical protein